MPVQYTEVEKKAIFNVRQKLNPMDVHQTNAETISMQCLLCYELISSRKATALGDMMFHGSCTNINCSNKAIQYLCKWCYDYSSNNQAPGRIGGGRKGGIYGSIKAFRRHFQSKTHQQNYQQREKIRADFQQAVMSNEYDDITDDINESNVFDNINEAVETNQGNYKHNEDEARKKDFANQLKECGFDKDSKSPAYYAFLNKNEGMGAQYLTAKAFSVDVTLVTEEEATFSLLMANLLCQLTNAQQKLLAEILKFASNAKDKKNSIFEHTRVPISQQDFDDLYIKGCDSILINLPHPVPQLTDDKSHAYVTLTDVLANELAAGTIFDDYYFKATIKLEDLNQDPPTISNTPSAYHLYWEMKEDETIVDTKILYLWLKEWRDDFDPNNTKSSRNQVWIDTYTVCPPNTAKRGQNTYFMAIASKGDDHSEVERLFGEELTKLSTTGARLYDGITKKIINVKVGKLITCVDRPERTSMFQIGDHNGTFSSNFGYAGAVDVTCNKNKLPSCPHCRQKRISRLVVERNVSNNVIDDNTVITCEQKLCSNWNVMENEFTFPAPKFYPTQYDKRVGAPLPPAGREVDCPVYMETLETNTISESVLTDHIVTNKRRRVPVQQTIQQRLRTVKLSVEWLQSAILFALHNIKTINPDHVGSKASYYWTQGNLSAFLRSCSVTNKLTQEVFACARKTVMNAPFPNTWDDKSALQKCHYAAMHMLFLGHTKSNFDMTATWLAGHDLKTTFGKQVNKYLDLIRRLRSHKYYNAHSLSTSSWGTGTWVSENYVFWARTQKFWFVLPCIMHSKQMEKPEFRSDIKMIHRFASAALSAMSLIMSAQRTIPHMDVVIKVYMDTMAELDHWMNKNENSKKKPNFVKSNSLGILCAAEAHDYLGPAILHWEGGYSGERKIQEVKPLLSIKRENANWQQITLRRLYQLDTIAKLMEKIPRHSEMIGKQRETEGLLKIYASSKFLEEAVTSCNPLSGVLDEDHRVWLACRPSGKATRSSVMLLQLTFDDHNGENVADLCWMSAIHISNNSKLFASMLDVLTFSKQFVLLLPSLDVNGKDFSNKYYSIGSKWTERMSNGAYEKSSLNVITFNDWIQPSASVNHETISVADITHNPIA